MATSPKTNMDTQNDGLEKVALLNMAIFGIYNVSMLNFWGVYHMFFFQCSSG